ncbi:MAG: hypothetical protein KAJ29_05155 [Alphaproteobacteria bacterium]|nr:hypothetical protein [Alphaproteobacteria bacterium]
MKYEVQHYILCDGWINTWTIYEDSVEKLHVFSSEALAQAELDEFFRDIEAEIQSGARNIDQSYERSEFRIVCCSNT